MSFAIGFPRRVARGLGAVVLADLITGLAGFSVITSATLWYFCLSWIRLQGEYAHIGTAFGSPGQLALAWLGAFALLPLLGTTVFLAIRAYRLPRALLH
ncbi:MAG TPA: hypothetical protein VJQ43_01245 [Thermoplasmata archaeon]|nr:hypothetical protein [Thermoplasmata archaeon]